VLGLRIIDPHTCGKMGFTELEAWIERAEKLELLR
jgi:hypothetical protein